MQIDIKVTGSQELSDALLDLAKKASNTRHIHEIAATVIEDDIERNFAAQSFHGKSWKPLAPSTRRAKARRGYSRILQNRGSLAGSFTSQVSAANATVGTNLVYAPIHQFGGRAGRGHRSIIPARPFMPIEGGVISPRIEREIIEEVVDYLGLE